MQHTPQEYDSEDRAYRTAYGASRVDMGGHSRRELYKRAQRLGVEGRSGMDKRELALAIARRQD